MRFAIIDGTGSLSDSKYNSEMKDSFCRQLAAGFNVRISPKSDWDDSELNGRACHYQRGPSTDGISVRMRAHRAAEWLGRGRAPYYLAGYSRGGSAAIYAAELLEGKGKNVEGLFLFDAVARHAFVFGRVIPANVKFSFHLHRMNSLDDIDRYDNTIDFNAGNPLRPWFGQTGTCHRGAGVHLTKGLKGSHAALGGAGWKAVAGDKAASEMAAQSMNVYLIKMGLGVTLKGVEPIF